MFEQMMAAEVARTREQDRRRSAERARDLALCRRPGEGLEARLGLALAGSLIATGHALRDRSLAS